MSFTTVSIYFLYVFFFFVCMAFFSKFLLTMMSIILRLALTIADILHKFYKYIFTLEISVEFYVFFINDILSILWTKFCFECKKFYLVSVKWFGLCIVGVNIPLKCLIPMKIGRQIVLLQQLLLSVRIKWRLMYPMSPPMWQRYFLVSVVWYM